MNWSDWLFTIANGALALACIVMSRFSKDKGDLTFLSLVFFLIWLAYVSAWTDYPFAGIFWKMGLYIKSEDTWPMIDGLYGALALAVGWNKWWGVLLWGVALLSGVLHIMYSPLRLIDFAEYSGALDKTFLASAAVFFLAGGRGFVDFCLSTVNSWRSNLGPLWTLRPKRDQHG